ncbi:MAG: Holliday junction branch migration protein RuvA [Rickettsiales bacterium]|jgi:Holliday junction DNA helicase RuvA|nr:Holliday junction branch migration protein RuvA [Rickettsiales bacterium]
MFGKLQGGVDFIGGNYAIIMANGVGFKVLLAANVLGRLREGAETSLWIETIVREDAIILVGFETINDQELFGKLIGVSGVGAKVALAIMGTFKSEVLRAAIATGDIKTLTEAPGVGKKVAEKIIVELRGNVEAVLSGGGGDDAVQDALSALETLGYRRADCVELVQGLAAEDDTAQSLITKALKEIGAKK